MTDKFSPPRHNKAAHSALSSLFFFPSPSPLLFPSYPCVSVSSSQPSTPSRLPPLLRHKTSPSPSLHLDPFTGTNSLQIAPGNLISTFPISWEPILAEKKNYTGVTNWHEPCIRRPMSRAIWQQRNAERFDKGGRVEEGVRVQVCRWGSGGGYSFSAPHLSRSFRRYGWRPGKL